MAGKGSSELVVVRKDVLMDLLAQAWKCRDWMASLDERSWADEQTLLRADADELKELLERMASSVDVLTGSVADLRHLVADLAWYELRRTPEKAIKGWMPRKIAGGK